MDDENSMVEEQLKKLPPALQKAFSAVPWKSVVNQIAGLHNLKLEQAEIVERETMFILYGFESPDDYVANMAREAEIDENFAFNIATEANEKIFKVISQKVEELEKNTSVQAPTATTPTTLPVLEPDFAKETLATKPGEGVHEAASVELNKVNKLNKEEEKSQTAQVPVNEPLKSTYPSGVDPYREPLQ